MKKTLAIVLALVMVIALFAACGSTETETKTETKTEEKTTETVVKEAKEEAVVSEKVEEVEHAKPISVRVALQNSAVKMGPDMIINPYNCIIANGVYERLAERKYFGSTEIIGVLLKSWEAYNDDYSYHCELFDYIVDQDGNPFTTADVEWCINMQATEANKTQAKKVEKVEIIDDYKFDITFKENYEGFFCEFCEATWFATQAAFEKAQADNGICVGTGPYRPTEFVSNSYLIVEKEPTYWQTNEDLRAVTSRANVDVIRYDIVTEVTQMGIAISDNKTFQMAGYVSEGLIPDAIAAEGSGNGMKVECIKSSQAKMFGFNCTENSPCQDVNLRKAILYALNNEACAVANYSGIAFIPGALGISSLVDYDPAWETGDYYNYNMDKAREYLEKAGYDPKNAGITLTYLGNNTAENQNNGVWITGCLAELGINVELMLVESAASSTYKNDFASGWDMQECGQTPSNLYNYEYLASYADGSAHGGHSIWGDESAELQALVDKVKANDKAAFDELRNMMVDDALVYYFLGRYFCVVHDENITNVVTDWRNSLAVGACTFDAAYDHYVE